MKPVVWLLLGLIAAALLAVASAANATPLIYLRCDYEQYGFNPTANKFVKDVSVTIDLDNKVVAKEATFIADITSYEGGKINFFFGFENTGYSASIDRSTGTLSVHAMLRGKLVYIGSGRCSKSDPVF